MTYEQVCQEATASVLLNVAIETGDSDAKFMAVEFANKVDAQFATFLGRQAVESLLTETETPLEYEKVHELEDVWSGVGRSWVSPRYVRAFNAASQAIGSSRGISLSKPRTDEEYFTAAMILDDHANRMTGRRLYHIGNSSHIRQNADWAQSTNKSLIKWDWSVLGTARMSDAIDCLLHDRDSQTRDRRMMDELTTQLALAQ